MRFERPHDESEPFHIVCDGFSILWLIDTVLHYKATVTEWTKNETNETS